MDNTQLPATQIQIRHHRQTLNTRAQDRIVQSDFFFEAWTLATGKQREKVLEYMDKLDHLKVKNWILRIMIGTLDRCNVKVLRSLAQYHQIKNYSRLSKTKLLDALNTKGVINDSRNIDGDDYKTSIRAETDLAIG